MEHYNDTKRFFDKVASEKKGYYDAKSAGRLTHSPYQMKVRKKVMETFGRLRTKNNLDVGCGNGDFTINIARKYPKLYFTGIDFSEKAIGIAKASSHEIKNVSFTSGNILALPFSDNSFDSVLCINVLHHIRTEEAGKAIRELARVAKNNIIIEIKNNDNFYYKYIRTDFGRKPASVDNLRVYPTTTREVKKILSRESFSLIKTKPLWIMPSLSPLIVLHFRRR